MHWTWKFPHVLWLFFCRILHILSVSYFKLESKIKPIFAFDKENFLSCLPIIKLHLNLHISPNKSLKMRYFMPWEIMAHVTFLWWLKDRGEQEIVQKIKPEIPDSVPDKDHKKTEVLVTGHLRWVNMDHWVLIVFVLLWSSGRTLVLVLLSLIG